MISSRFAIPTALILSVAIVPTVIHSYLNLSIDNSHSSKNISTILGDFTGIPSHRNDGWGSETFGCIDWFERNYHNTQGGTVRLFVGRGYDHKRLYHHPELALSHAVDLRNDGQVVLSENQLSIPVNVLRHNTRPSIAAFALFYDGHFIDDPIAHQLKNSLSLLINAKKPITLFYVSEDNVDNQIPFEKTLSAKVLLGAVKYFLAQQH